ncbi:MAG: hypothetical protein JW786_04165 [Desulfobacterales bacterium]|nr:hypothetical protein [Desulfobacterales bacterium]
MGYCLYIFSAMLLSATAHATQTIPRSELVGCWPVFLLCLGVVGIGMWLNLSRR